jgi:hypothetical protein
VNHLRRRTQTQWVGGLSASAFEGRVRPWTHPIMGIERRGATGPDDQDRDRRKAARR